MPSRKNDRANGAKPSADARKFNVTTIRRRYPALGQKVNGGRPVYFDNPGGTQTPRSVIDAMRRYMIEANCNQHGCFHTSELTDQVINDTREAMADLLNAPSADEIVFGPNMTTLTFQMSRAIGITLSRGDQIILTRMDHDANIAPWLLIARDHSLKVRWVDFDPSTGLLDMAGLEKQITPRTKLIACGYASNALGTINDIKKITQIAHQAGAMIYVDAVQYAPHGPIDVQDLDCDFLVCSAYKFFGPHIGALYGKRQHLESLPAYKVRPAPDAIPERWEIGTKNHEGIAGTLAAVEYLDWIGEEFGKQVSHEVRGYSGRRRRLKLAMHAIKDYEKTLSEHLLDGMGRIKNVTIAGITDKKMLDQRVPTFIFNVKGMSPAQVATEMGKRGIYVWDGNYYALEVMERLGREEHGGMVRVGAAHYNTMREVNLFVKALKEIAGNGLKVIEGGKGKAAEKAAPKKKAGTRRKRQVIRQARGRSPKPDLSA